MISIRNTLIQTSKLADMRSLIHEIIEEKFLVNSPVTG